MAGILEKCLIIGAGELGLDLGREKLEAFREYYRMLMEENSKYNLTSIRGEEEVAVKHFLDSLTCLGMLDLNGEFVVDLGSGAGFPGIPLKIMRPEMDLLLVDSVNKKVEFLKALIKRLGLEKAGARWDRAENMGSGDVYRERAGVVVSRAVAPLGVLAELCLPLVRVGGCFLAMKGPGVEEEMETARKAVDIMGGKVEKVENLRLPLIPEDRRLILVRKESATPEGYPRRPGIPAKKPIV